MGENASGNKRQELGEKWKIQCLVKERTGRNGTVSSFGKGEAAGAVSPSYSLQPRLIIPQTFPAFSSCISYPWRSGTCSFTPNLWHLKSTFLCRDPDYKRMASDSSKRLCKAEVTRWNSYGTYWAGIFIYLFIFWLHTKTCRISISWPGTEPRPWQWRPGILTTRPPGNSQILLGFVFIILF